MAVFTGVYGQKKEEYAGCVIHTYEVNGYDDSDWYAVCWDEEEQKVVDVLYDTTRAGGGGWAKVDLSCEAFSKAYRYYYEIGRQLFDSRTKFAEAKRVRKDDEVVVIKGRKTPQGTVGTVFWVGKRYNQYSRKDEDRVGIKVGEEKIFLPLEYVEVIGWEKRVATGKERKRQIRNFAIHSFPYYYAEMIKAYRPSQKPF